MKSNFAFELLHPTRFIQHSMFIHSAIQNGVAVIVLNELVDSDDEKPTRGKTRKWIRTRKERGYFTNIIQELIVEDRHDFREMFRMDVGDFEFILSKISDLIIPNERLGGTRPIESDERLALNIRLFSQR